MKAALTRLIDRFPRRPAFSIVVVIYNMEREAKRTLYSLSLEYQQDVKYRDYEVIVVDNGSIPRFPKDFILSLKGNFRYFYLHEASPSPAAAINFGVLQSRGRYVGIMIDGARILTPGVLQFARKAFRAFRNSVVATLAWHLGPAIQSLSITQGYSRVVEDELLAGIGWERNGYRLFEISTLAVSSEAGWFLPIGESNCFFMTRECIDRVNGADERFDSPAGGFVNHDIYKRVSELSEIERVILLGEGSFHQIHGGIATNADEQVREQRVNVWAKEYELIRGKPYTPPDKPAKYVGHAPPESKCFLAYSANRFLGV